MCAYVCVCVSERKRERERDLDYAHPRRIPPTPASFQPLSTNLLLYQYYICTTLIVLHLFYFYLFIYFFSSRVHTTQQKYTPAKKRYLSSKNPLPTFRYTLVPLKRSKLPVYYLGIPTAKSVRKKLLMKRHRNSKIILFSLTLSPPPD